MSTDKIDLHYQQQLSAWMDGDLQSDQARFLLRRLQHDAELTGRLERWQLCGDALRGNAQALAPPGFAERVAAAVAVAPPSAAASGPHAERPRRSLRVWGGGALAASVAAIALLVVRQQVPDQAPMPVVANPSPATANRAEPPTATAATALAAASGAVAAAPRRQAASVQRRSTSRAQQTASRRVASAQLPERAVAAAAVAVPVVHALAGAATAAPSQRDPFSSVQINAPAARPWPRAVLPQYPSSSGGFNAGFSSDHAAQSFYPFEPRVTERLPVPRTGPVPQE